MMTSLAFILGVVPLMISTGAGSEMRQTLGIAVFSGMLGVTLFGIFLTPVFYYVIQWITDRRGPAEPAGEAEIVSSGEFAAVGHPAAGHAEEGRPEHPFDGNGADGNNGARHSDSARSEDDWLATGARSGH
jgi:hypothetical protein